MTSGESVTGAATPAPPVVSPDGRFYLDGGRWVPFPVAAEVSRRAVVEGTAEGLARLVLGFVVVTFGLPVLLVVALTTEFAVLPERVVPAAMVVTVVLALVALVKLIRRGVL